MVFKIRLFSSLDVTMFMDVLMKPHLLKDRIHSQQCSTQVTNNSAYLNISSSAKLKISQYLFSLFCSEGGVINKVGYCQKVLIVV